MLGLRRRDNGDERIRPEVKEIQDEFLNIYRRTYDNEKNWAARFSEEINPQTQADLDTITTGQKQIENFIKVLEDKMSLITPIVNGIVDIGKSQNFIKALQSFGNSFDIITQYNSIIRKYLDPEVNSKTKEELKNQIQQSVPYLNQLITLTYKLFNNLFEIIFPAPDAGVGVGVAAAPGAETKSEKNLRYKREAVKGILPITITTFMVLLLIQKNLFRNTYSLIEKPQIDVQYKNWLASIPDLQRDYIKSITEPTEADINEAAKRRIKLIEEDRGYPLSKDEQIKLHNSLFGVTSNKTYTPDELRLLKEEQKKNAEFSESRQRDIEARTTEAQLRADAGLPPVYFAPEPPLPEPNDNLGPEQLANIRKQQYSEELGTEIQYLISEMMNKIQKFLDSSASEFNKILTKLGPDVVYTAKHKKQREIQQQIQRNNAFAAKEYIINLYKKGYEILTNTPPSLADITNIMDNYINHYPQLTNANINNDKFRSTLARRTEFDNQIRDSYDDIINQLDAVKDNAIEKLKENVMSKLGKGKPRNKVSQAIHYYDEMNDPYLVK